LFLSHCVFSVTWALLPEINVMMMMMMMVNVFRNVFQGRSSELRCREKK